VLGFLAAAGLLTVAGLALFGLVALIALVPVVLVWLRRTRRRVACRTVAERGARPVPVELGRRD
jgi:hypothetical protein